VTALQIPAAIIINAIRKTTASYAAEAEANELTVKMILGDTPNDVWRSYA